MTCPQGLTLSGKMCTIAPVMSCPTGYTLVNNMCQQDDGLQGYGDSINMPPTDGTPMLSAADIVQQQQMPSPQSPMPMQQGGTALPDILKQIDDIFPKIPGQVADIAAALPGQINDVLRAPQIQALSPQTMPMRPLSPQKPRMEPLSPQPMRPSSPSGQCPMGYMMNSSDKMCYPL